MAAGENGKGELRKELNRYQINVPVAETRQSQQSDLAKTLLTQRLPSTLTPTNTLSNISNIPNTPPTMSSPIEAAQTTFHNGFLLPSPTLVVGGQTVSYGRNLTPLSSAGSTAPNSPRL